MNLEINESKIGAIFIMTQLNCQSWLFFNIFIFLSISTIFIVNSSFIGISSWQRGPRVAIWVGTCIGNQAKVKSVKGGRGVGVQGREGELECQCMGSSRPLHPPHRCPSWRCPACLLPSLKQWPPPRSACCAPCRTSCCWGLSRGHPAGESPGTFSAGGQRYIGTVRGQRILGVLSTGRVFSVFTFVILMRIFSW